MAPPLDPHRTGFFVPHRKFRIFERSNPEVASGRGALRRAPEYLSIKNFAPRLGASFPPGRFFIAQTPVPNFRESNPALKSGCGASAEHRVQSPRESPLDVPHWAGFHSPRERDRIRWRPGDALLRNHRDGPTLERSGPMFVHGTSHPRYGRSHERQRCFLAPVLGIAGASSLDWIGRFDCLHAVAMVAVRETFPRRTHGIRETLSKDSGRSQNTGTSTAPVREQR